MMKTMFSKIVGFVAVVCVGIGFVGCASSGAPKCDSSEVKKAFKKRFVKEGMEEVFGEIKISDFKTLSEDKDYPNTMNCRCVVTMDGERLPLTFSAERLESGKIAIVMD